MKNIFLFYFVISLFFVLINNQSIFILSPAEEKSSLDKDILSFNIQAGINEDINSDITFQIESEFYDNNNYIKDKKIDCTIPKTLDASFATKIIIKCSINLYEIDCLNANKVKFIKFIKNSNIEINDQKQNVLTNDLIFSKRIKQEPNNQKEKKRIQDIKADYEFTADKITLLKYFDNKLIFLIKGQYNSRFMSSFEFDLIINRNLKSQCKSPSLFFEKEGNINCTLIIQKNNEYFLESFRDGIVIEENVYNVKISNQDKIFKFNIRQGDKLEIKDFDLKNEQKFKEDKEDDEEKKSEWEIQREIDRRRREKEREEEKKRKDQEELEDFLKRRKQNDNNNQNNYQKNYETGNYDQNRYQNNPNNNNNYYYPNNYNYNNNNNFYQNQNPENDQIDYNSNVKLLHLQVRYSYDIIYYLFYALTPIPLNHKIKVGFSLSTSGYNYGETNKINRNIILTAEEAITTNDKSIIVEYMARFECSNCKKLVVDKNSIYGAKIYNFPREDYLLDAININQMGNYLQKNKMQSPPLYITENIFNQNCKLELAGNFFNRNKFFISKFPLKLIGTGFNSEKNVTIYCSLNEREIFSCPINEIINNFEFKLEQFIVDQKENIVIDNSKMTRDRMSFHASCQNYNNYGISINNNRGINPLNQNQNDIVKNSEQMPGILIKKRRNWKKICLIIISLVVAYYVITKCCCKKEEEEENVEYDSRWRVSSSSYGGETYGLRNRGW